MAKMHTSKIRSQFSTLCIFSILLFLVNSGCVQNENTSFTEEIGSYSRDMWELTENFTRDCMKAQGFDYEIRQYSVSESVGVASISPYNISLEEAQIHGFGAVDAQIAVTRELQIAPFPSSEETQTSEKTSYESALYGNGISGSGCAANAQVEASSKLDVNGYPSITKRLEIVEKIIADPRVDVFWKAWSECMSKTGIIARNMDILQDSFIDKAAKLLIVDDSGKKSIFRISTAKANVLRNQEISAAVAGVKCLQPIRRQWEEITADVQS